jgi:hypothetical protein
MIKVDYDNKDDIDKDDDNDDDDVDDDVDDNVDVDDGEFRWMKTKFKIGKG